MVTLLNRRHFAEHAASLNALHTAVTGTGHQTRFMSVQLQFNGHTKNVVNVHIHHCLAKKPRSESFKRVIAAMQSVLCRSSVVAGDLNQANFKSIFVNALTTDNLKFEALTQGEEYDEPCNILVATPNSSGIVVDFDAWLLEHGSHHPVAARIR